MRYWYSVVDSSRYILVVVVVILDIARNSCCFSVHATNSSNDSTTTTTTTTTINQRTCLPLPSDVLWRRLNPQIPYSDGNREAGLNNNNDEDYHQSFTDGNWTVKSAAGSVVQHRNGTGSKMKSRDDDDDNDDDDESRDDELRRLPFETTFRASSTKNQTTSSDDVRRMRRIRKRRLHVRLLRRDDVERERAPESGPSEPGVYEPVTSDESRRRRKRKLSNDKGRPPRLQRLAISVEQQQQQQQQQPHLRHKGQNMPPVATAWHCRLEKYWKKMKDGIFPGYVQTGRCTTRTCMMGMYECRPKKYAVGVLKRLKDRCNPMPLSSGGNTTYEDVWIAGHYKVTVACECAKKKRSGSYGPT